MPLIPNVQIRRHIPALFGANQRARPAVGTAATAVRTPSLQQRARKAFFEAMGKSKKDVAPKPRAPMVSALAKDAGVRAAEIFARCRRGSQPDANTPQAEAAAAPAPSPPYPALTWTDAEAVHTDLFALKYDSQEQALSPLATFAMALLRHRLGYYGAAGHQFVRTTHRDDKPAVFVPNFSAEDERLELAFKEIATCCGDTIFPELKTPAAAPLGAAVGQAAAGQAAVAPPEAAPITSEALLAIHRAVFPVDETGKPLTPHLDEVPALWVHSDNKLERLAGTDGDGPSLVLRQGAIAIGNDSKPVFRPVITPDPIVGRSIAGNTFYDRLNCKQAQSRQAQGTSAGVAEPPGILPTEAAPFAYKFQEEMAEFRDHRQALSHHVSLALDADLRHMNAAKKINRKDPEAYPAPKTKPWYQNRATRAKQAGTLATTLCNLNAKTLETRCTGTESLITALIQHASGYQTVEDLPAAAQKLLGTDENIHAREAREIYEALTQGLNERALIAAFGEAGGVPSDEILRKLCTAINQRFDSDLNFQIVTQDRDGGLRLLYPLADRDSQNQDGKMITQKPTLTILQHDDAFSAIVGCPPIYNPELSVQKRWQRKSFREKTSATLANLFRPGRPTARNMPDQKLIESVALIESGEGEFKNALKIQILKEHRKKTEITGGIEVADPDAIKVLINEIENPEESIRLRTFKASLTNAEEKRNRLIIPKYDWNHSNGPLALEPYTDDQMHAIKHGLTLIGEITQALVSIGAQLDRPQPVQTTTPSVTPAPALTQTPVPVTDAAADARAVPAIPGNWRTWAHGLLNRAAEAAIGGTVHAVASVANSVNEKLGPVSDVVARDAMREMIKSLKSVENEIFYHFKHGKSLEVAALSQKISSLSRQQLPVLLRQMDRNVNAQKLLADSQAGLGLLKNDNRFRLLNNLANLSHTLGNPENSEIEMTPEIPSDTADAKIAAYARRYPELNLDVQNAEARKKTSAALRDLRGRRASLIASDASLDPAQKAALEVESAELERLVKRHTAITEIAGSFKWEAETLRAFTKENPNLDSAIATVNLIEQLQRFLCNTYFLRNPDRISDDYALAEASEIKAKELIDNCQNAPDAINQLSDDCSWGKTLGAFVELVQPPPTTPAPALKLTQFWEARVRDFSEPIEKIERRCDALLRELRFESIDSAKFKLAELKQKAAAANANSALLIQLEERENQLATELEVIKAKHKATVMTIQEHAGLGSVKALGAEQS